MPTCLQCRKKFGFLAYFTMLWAKTGNGPYCRQCFARRTALLMLWHRQNQKAGTDPKAAAWVALCHLVCMEHVNVRVREPGGETIESVLVGRTWPASKAMALDFAERACRNLPVDSAGRRLLHDIQRRASSMTAPPGEEVRWLIKRTDQLPAFPNLPDDLLPPSALASYPSHLAHLRTGFHYLWDTEWAAFLSGEATIDDLLETLRSLPGQEWLDRSAIDEACEAAG